jgi:hypothetical protein
MLGENEKLGKLSDDLFFVPSPMDGKVLLSFPALAPIVSLLRSANFGPLLVLVGLFCPSLSRLSSLKGVSVNPRSTSSAIT